MTTPEGLRRDGRRALELRHLRHSLSHTTLLSQGNTTIAVKIQGPQEGKTGVSLTCPRDLFSLKQLFTSVEIPRSQIHIDVQILEQDGSVLATAINAITLALIHAGISMQDYIVAATASIIQDTVLVDLNHSEENLDLGLLTLAKLPRSGKIVFLNVRF